MTRVIGAALVLSMFCVLLSGTGMIGTTVAEASVSRHADVEMVGVVIVRFRDAAAGFSPRERANIVYQRLNNAISAAGDQLSPAHVRVQSVQGSPAIFLGDHLIATADAHHAMLNATTPELLAEAWAGNLRRAVLRYLMINAE